MARLRYVKGARDSASKVSSGRPIDHTVRSIRALYETEPEIAAAVLPRPLEPFSRPEIFVQLASVSMHLADDRALTIGAATVGVACTHEGRSGYYVLAMPMEGEFVVIGGRERYGEPKKLARAELSFDGASVRGKVERHGVTFLELGGRVGDELEKDKRFTEHFYCYKAMPAADPEGSGRPFDGDVLLTLLTWERRYTSLREIVDAELILRDSPHDPLVDVPVKRLLRMELAEGATQTRGEVLRAVPGEWLEPFLVQRYDDPREGVEISLASERKASDA